jgi:hypothetical protein
MRDISEAMGGSFDTNSVDPATGFDPIPAGWYPVQIDTAEVLDTKAKNGKRLKLEVTIVGEQFAGRKLFPAINLVNPNPQCVEIGMRELAALGQACGLAAIADSSELLGKIVLAKVKVKQDPGFDPNNEVVGYKPAVAAAPAAAAAPARTTPTPKPTATTKAAPAPTATAPAKAGKRPWER